MAQSMILYSTQLLVEGNDELNFLRTYCSFIGITDVDIHSFSGNDRLPHFLAGFVNIPGFQVVRSVGILMDAEGRSAGAAMDKVRSAVERSGLGITDRYGGEGRPAVETMILPDNQGEGMFETLLWRSVSSLSMRECVETFLRCAEQSSGQEVQRRDKARVHAYLATKPQPHVSVGVAAQKDYWDLAHPAFDDLRAFLSRVASVR